MCLKEKSGKLEIHVWYFKTYLQINDDIQNDNYSYSQRIKIYL